MVRRAIERSSRLMGRLDALQRRFVITAITVAVFRKFSKDGGGRLAALIAYFGFFSLFPLLLVLVTVSGSLLQGDPRLQAKIATSAVAEFPIVGAQIRHN